MDKLTHDEIRLRLPATPLSSRIARVAATGLATRVGFSYEEVDHLALATAEAWAIVAGDRPGEGSVTVVFAVEPAGLSVDVEASQRHHADAEAVDLARRVLDHVVDKYEVSRDRRRVHLAKHRTERL